MESVERSVRLPDRKRPVDLVFFLLAVPTAGLAFGCFVLGQLWKSLDE